MKILIVDDEDKIRQVIKEYCENNNYETDEAENGKIGLEKLLNNKYDLLILDIMMPEMDGFSMLKECPKEKRIPTIVLTYLGIRCLTLYKFIYRQFTTARAGKTTKYIPTTSRLSTYFEIKFLTIIAVIKYAHPDNEPNSINSSLSLLYSSSLKVSFAIAGKSG